MKKKTLMNKQVVKAISIGLAAVLTVSPMQAFAAEDGETTPTESGSSGESGNPSSSSSSESSSSSSSESEESKGVSNTKDSVNKDGGVKDSVAVAESAEKTATSKVDKKSDTTEVKDAAAELDEVKKGETENTSATDTTKSATDSINAVDGNLDAAKSAADAVTEAETKATGTVEEAGKIADEAKETVEEAKATYDKQVASISLADNEEAAKAAYDASEQTAEDAQKAYDDAQAAYEEKTNEYNAALADLAAAQKDYNNALASAGENAEDAAKVLADAKTKAEALQTAAENAQAEVNKSKDVIDALKDMNKSVWRPTDKVFEKIVRDYYMPQVVGAQEVKDVKLIFGSAEENQVNLNIDKKNTDQCEANRFEITYIDKDGKEQIAYYNYKMDGTDLIIFEKVFADVKIADAVEEHYEGIGTNGNKISYNVGDELTKAEAEGTEAVVVQGTQVIAKDVDENGVVDGENKILVEDTNGVVKDSTTKESTDVQVGAEKKESYVYDETNGTLVKQVKADVTTITYKEESLNSGFTFDSKADAETAMEREFKEEDLNTDGVTVSSEAHDEITYTANGTYISAFTATINLKNEKTESENHIEEDRSADVAKKYGEDAIAKAKEELCDKYYVISTENNATATKDEPRFKKEGILWWEKDVLKDTYTQGGSISITYVKKDDLKVKYSTWDDFKDLFHGNKKEEEIKQAVKEKIEKEGGIFLEFESFNWNTKTATIVYIPGQQIATTSECENEADAQSAAKGATAGIDADNSEYKKQAEDMKKAVGGTSVSTAGTAANVKINTQKIVTNVTKYGYSGTYDKYQGEKTINQVIETTTWNATKLTHISAKEAQYEQRAVSNKNYYDKKYLMEEKVWRQETTDKYNHYQAILDEVADANDAVTEAQKKVENLQRQIENLKNQGIDRTAEIADLNDKLDSAFWVLKEAENSLKEITDKKDEAKKAYEDTVARIERERAAAEEEARRAGGSGSSSSSSRGGSSSSSSSGTTTNTTPATNPATVTIPEGVTPLAATVNDVETLTPVSTVQTTGVVAPVRRAATTAVQNNGAGENAQQVAVQEPVVIADEQTPLADTIATPDQKASTTTIADEETPLANVPIDQKNISWWWALIIALLGATGVEMYRRHLKKENEVVSDTKGNK